jgi:hypothetical protein
MGKILEDEKTIVDIRAAMTVLSEKLEFGQQLSENIHTTYDKILENSEYLKQSIDQIAKLKENISIAATEIVTEEIAQQRYAYDVIQYDYNKNMEHMRMFVYVSTAANFLLLIATIVGIVMSHR